MKRGAQKNYYKCSLITQTINNPLIFTIIVYKTATDDDGRRVLSANLCCLSTLVLTMGAFT